jgi:hypothetical protein
MVGIKPIMKPVLLNYTYPLISRLLHNLTSVKGLNPKPNLDQIKGSFIKHSGTTYE